MEDDLDNIKEKFKDHFKQEIELCSTDPEVFQKLLKKYKKDTKKKE